MKTLLKALNDRSPLATSDRPDEQFEARWRNGLKRRVLVALCAVALWGTGVEARLVFLQVVQHDFFVDRADQQQNHELHPAAGRGDIVDRNGDILAYSIKAASIVAAPSAIKPAEVAKTVDALCGAFRDCTPKERQDLLSRLSAKGSYAPVRRAMFLTTEQIDRVKALKLPGITLLPDSRRFYPKLSLAAHVLGFVGVDNNGLAGIEGQYDDQIRGEAGLVYTQVDGRQRQMEMRVEREATDGATIELTLDAYLQYIVERELKASVDGERADAGTALVMDPATGQILALASYPTFDPNAFATVTPEASRNRAIQDIYEPGSTFKIVTASAGLEEGVWSMNDMVDTSPGRFAIGPRIIRDSEGHNYGVLSFEDVIVKSSNVGAAKIALRVGADRFARYVSRLGFGQTLLPDLKGESRGRVANFKNVHDSSLASMAMGYEVGVTPLQMATAVSAVANGGTLYQPRLVRSITRNGVRDDVAPKVLRQAITKETATTLTSIMEEVVRRGTGTKAAMAGYQVAGKTGTA
jgi:cell division protein FtsI/penicillin-binding protein 2